MIALNDSLVSEYINFTIFNRQPDDSEKIQYLFKYLQPFKCHKNQCSLFKDPSLISQITDNPILKIINVNNDTDLVNSTQLKLMLVDENIDENFTIVNIFEDEIDIRYSSTYKAGESRQKAIEHIKALISDARHINIIDFYLGSHWSENKIVLEKVLPKKNISIFIDCQGENPSNNTLKQNYITELKDIYQEWSFKTNNYKLNKNGYGFENIHDRYIITDKLEIILTSGFEYIWNTKKDFTYIVKVK